MWDEENVLEIDGTDDDTLKVQHLKTVQIVSVIYISPQLKKHSKQRNWHTLVKLLIFQFFFLTEVRASR